MELLYTDIYNAAQQDAKQKHYFIFPLMDMWVPQIARKDIVISCLLFPTKSHLCVSQDAG
jgi:hypothetical protein